VSRHPAANPLWPEPRAVPLALASHAAQPAVSAWWPRGRRYETYDIRLVDLATGAELDECLKSTGGSVAWADDSTLFYVVQDAQHRPFQVWRHALGTAQAEDVLVYEDLDELYNVGCWTSRDGSLLLIEAESKETTGTLPPVRR
jgi:oligopeptidase B